MGDSDGEEEVAASVVWEGELVDGVPDGPGKATYPNGDFFEGVFANGRRQGKGKYTFANGAFYEGEYADNVKQGQGVMEYPDKGRYEGSWAQDQRDGLGTYAYPNGDTFGGSWRAGQKHGKGTYFFKESMSQFEGTWENGSFVSGSWIMRDGSSYEGAFAANRPLGPGEFRFEGKAHKLPGEFLPTGGWKSGGIVAAH
eukprot:TRINITY_DN8338_c0_g1_i1.p1 TRINITY_DN8338_c0_g1~~TRINITY_DN8338_c0_g1_i1.p1  ORF type:complete len:198 (-),score=43.98 TRINITY_DN8338_c0_g1_i1:400-993(-)